MAKIVTSDSTGLNSTLYSSSKRSRILTVTVHITFPVLIQLKWCSVCSLIWVTSQSKARSWGQLIWNIYIKLYICKIYISHTHTHTHTHTHIYIYIYISNIWWGDFPDSSVGKESAYNEGDPGLIPASSRSTGEGTGYGLQYSWASPVVHLVRNPPAMWETWVWFLGWEDSLGKGKATHSSISVWRIPVMSNSMQPYGLYSPWNSPGENFHKGSQPTVESMGYQRVWHNLTTFTFTFFHLIV